MRRQLLTSLGTAAVAATLVLWPGPAAAGRGPGYGGYHGGYAGYHGYHGHPGYYGPHGYYGRGYYPYGFSIGIGIYVPYGYGPYVPYTPYPAVVNYNNNYYPPAPVVGESPPNPPPQADNAAHLKIIVPADAQVWFDGNKAGQAGTEREFVSPPLPPGKKYTYNVRALWTDNTGRVHDETRPLHVGANDWFLVDFTKPAPSEDLPVPPPPARGAAPGTVPPAEAK